MFPPVSRTVIPRCMSVIALPRQDNPTNVPRKVTTGSYRFWHNSNRHYSATHPHRPLIPVLDGSSHTNLKTRACPFTAHNTLTGTSTCNTTVFRRHTSQTIDSVSNVGVSAHLPVDSSLGTCVTARRYLHSSAGTRHASASIDTGAGRGTSTGIGTGPTTAPSRPPNNTNPDSFSVHHIPLSDEALAQLFAEAHTAHGFQDKDVEERLLYKAVEMAQWGPTSYNCCPMRLIFVKSPESKNKLLSCLMEGNVAQTQEAPITAIVCLDEEFIEKLPELSPNFDALSIFRKNPSWIKPTMTRNGLLQQRKRKEGATETNLIEIAVPVPMPM